MESRYPRSGVVLDCIHSWSLDPYLLSILTAIFFRNRITTMFGFCGQIGLFFNDWMFKSAKVFAVRFWLVTNPRMLGELIVGTYFWMCSRFAVNILGSRNGTFYQRLLLKQEMLTKFNQTPHTVANFLLTEIAFSEAHHFWGVWNSIPIMVHVLVLAID